VRDPFDPGRAIRRCSNGQVKQKVPISYRADPKLFEPRPRRLDGAAGVPRDSHQTFLIVFLGSRLELSASHPSRGPDAPLLQQTSNDGRVAVGRFRCFGLKFSELSLGGFEICGPERFLEILSGSLFAKIVNFRC